MLSVPQVRPGFVPAEAELRAAVVARLAAPTERGERAAIDLRDLDLHDQNLAGLDLSGCDLRGVNLRGARLSRARLHAARLDGADLRGAELNDAILTEAQLAGALLDGASAERALLDGAVLPGLVAPRLKLRQASLVGANLAGADLREAALDGCRLHRGDLRGARLAGASLRGAELDGAQVDGASLREVDLRGARLRRVSGFASADWLGADLHDVDFSGAWRLRRFAIDQNYLEEFRTESRWHAWIFQLWRLTSDCGRSPGRWLLWTAFIAVVFALLYANAAIDFGPSRTAISPLALSVANLTPFTAVAARPLSAAAEALCIAEAALGYVLFAGFLSILSAQMTRLSE